METAPSTSVGIAFGPVPSRRLGRSLGVNNIPPKHCSYSCQYCQIGRSASREVERRAFHPPSEVVSAVERRVAECGATGQWIDYLTFVPDGEPTLDFYLGEEIRALRPLGIPVAVITNGSLLWRAAVRADLGAADLVSVKVDVADERAWRRLNRPGPLPSFQIVLAGMRRFARDYRGQLLTETMLVGGLNDDEATLGEVADLLEALAPARAYLALPTRPPAEARVNAPSEEAVVTAYEIMARRLPHVELLGGDEEGPFGRTGDPVQDLLAILAVHPMLETAVQEYLKDAGAGWEELEALLAHGQVVKIDHRGRVFFARRFLAAAPCAPEAGRSAQAGSRTEAGEQGTVAPVSAWRMAHPRPSSGGNPDEARKEPAA